MIHIHIAPFPFSKGSGKIVGIIVNEKIFMCPTAGNLLPGPGSNE
jgi:hypothetical protein